MMVLPVAAEVKVSERPSPSDPDLLRKLHTCKFSFPDTWAQDFTACATKSKNQGGREEVAVEVGVRYGGTGKKVLQTEHTHELRSFFEACEGVVMPENSPDPPLPNPKPSGLTVNTIMAQARSNEQMPEATVRMSLEKVVARELAELQSNGELCYKVRARHNGTLSTGAMCLYVSVCACMVCLCFKNAGFLLLFVWCRYGPNGCTPACRP
jgi:hypothetical protein